MSDTQHIRRTENQQEQVRRSIGQFEQQLEENRRDIRAVEERVDAVQYLMDQRHQSLEKLGWSWKGPSAEAFLRRGSELTHNTLRSLRDEAQQAHEQLQQQRKKLQGRCDEAEHEYYRLGREL